jgi:hypothetical protein
VPLQIQAHYIPDSRNRAFDTHTIPYAFKTHVIIVMSAHTVAHFGEMSVRIDDFGPGLPTAQPGPLLPVLRVVSVDAAAGPGRTALGSGPKTRSSRRKAGCSPTGRARRARAAGCPLVRVGLASCSVAAPMVLQYLPRRHTCQPRGIRGLWVCKPG